MKKIFVLFVCLFLFCSVNGSIAFAGQHEIRILYVNDFHGFAEGYKSNDSDEVKGGIAYLATLVERLRNEKPSLLLAAGDMIQGSNLANLFNGKPVIELMNMMKFDAMVVGNHEFDFGQAELKARISEAQFPFLGANIEGISNIKPYVIKEINGIKVAIIGVISRDTPIITHPKNVIGLKFLAVPTTVARYVEELRDRVDIIIVLSHIGYHDDMVLAGRVKNIDVIVGGHSHTRVERLTLIGKTIIVQAWEHGRALGVLDLTLKEGKIINAAAHLEEVKPASLEKDRTVSAIVGKYNKKVHAALDEIIGKTEIDLDGQNVRKRETNFGNLVADSIRQATGAQTAIINGGSIIMSIPKGDMSKYDIYSALPFDNYATAVTMNGKQIKEVLEHGISSSDQEDGRFPQVSGLKFTYSNSAEKDSRVKEISIDGKPIEPDKYYSVATNDFLAAGGDGYKMFNDVIRSSKNYSYSGGAIKGSSLIFIDPGRWIRDLLIEYIRNAKKIAPVVEGRIVELR